MSRPTLPAPSDHRPPGNGLLRVLDVDFGVAVILGSTIGVGILRLPGMVAGKMGNYWLILLVWALGGCYTLLGSFSVTELGAMLPQAGGFYVYARWAFGGFAGFAAGWGDWLNNCAAVAYGSVAAAGFFHALVPEFPVSGRFLALALLAGYGLLHWAGLRVSSVVQKVVSSATALALIFLAVACFLPGGSHPAVARTPSATATKAITSLGFFGALATLVVALRAVIVTYDGWYAAIYFTEEGKNPTRDFPRAMIGGVFLIIFLYLFLNVAFLHVLPISRLAASQLPAADAAQILFAGWSGKFITLLSLLTVLGLVNSVLLGATRIIFAIGRDGLFLKSAARVSPGGTPRPAMLLSAVAAGVLVATGTFDRIVAIAAILMVANYCLCYLALPVLRRREPNLARPFRAWGYPATTGIVLTGSVLFLIAAAVSDSRNAAYAAALLAACLPAYALMKRNNRRQTDWRG